MGSVFIFFLIAFYHDLLGVVRVGYLMREDYLSSENQHFNSSQRQGANAWERLRKKNKMEAIEKWESGGGEGVFLGSGFAVF